MLLEPSFELGMLTEPLFYSFLKSRKCLLNAVKSLHNIVFLSQNVT